MSTICDLGCCSIILFCLLLTENLSACVCLYNIQLPSDLAISWSPRLTKTAGFCRYKSDPTNHHNKIVSIELSIKVCDSPGMKTAVFLHFYSVVVVLTLKISVFFWFLLGQFGLKILDIEIELFTLCVWTSIYHVYSCIPAHPLICVYFYLCIVFFISIFCTLCMIL